MKLKKNPAENKLLLETMRVHLFKGRVASSFVKLKMEKIAYRLLARQLDNFHNTSTPESTLEDDDRQLLI